MIFNTHIFFSIQILAILISTVYSDPNSDYFVLSCGTTKSANDSNGRNWIPDSKFLTSSKNTFTATALSQDPSLPSPVPYMTARIFSSPSSYNFSLYQDSKTRYWIRLHFYPSSYNNFNCSNAFFSVTANEFTLLNNFSAAITAKALTQAYFIKEYSLKPLHSNGILSLSFVPSSNYKGSFAFINGIEIIPMPRIFGSADMVGFGDQTIYPEHNTLETMYRLNVGGQYISPNQDSELTRTWYDDTPYIFGAAIGVTSESNNSVPINYPKDLPNYIAPVNVYSTGRTMGPDPGINTKYNLTWVFQVDAKFIYLVRLHFCDYTYRKVNERVFAVYINNQTAYPSADVVAWTHGMGVPVYKDFALYVSNKTGVNEIRVALHPNISSHPRVYDAILNGMEIFRISDSKNNLAGPNPVPSALLTQAESNLNKSFAPSKSDPGLIVGIVFAALAAFGLLVGVMYFVKHRKRNGNGNKSCADSWLPIYMSSGTKLRTSFTKSSGSGVFALKGGLCRRFSLAEIKLATNNFAESQVIGVGGFGYVYKGVIDGRTRVAIKRANPSSAQGLNEFVTEIHLLSKLRHQHLVSLIGACEENDEMILVYDYMANGTLREHIIQSQEEHTLSWAQRLSICIGAARGLHYLHTGANNTIIHRDVKTTNILLDEKWVAKVSDFGLSKTALTLNQTHVSTAVKGSFGYLDPEYFRRQQLTDKSDVYSFGVVLLEVLCGRPPVNPSLPEEQISLADWAKDCHENGTLEDLINPRIRNEIGSECLKNFISIAMACLSDAGIDRPSMGTVLWNLEYALELQNNPDGPRVIAEQKANDAYAMHSTTTSVDKESSDSQNQTNVFSQIQNPQGR